MKCEIKDVDSPVARVRDIEDENLKQQAKVLAPQCAWYIFVRVISAYYLPELDRDYEIKISIQDKTVSTNKKTAINGSVDFNQTIQIQYNSISSDKLSLPDLFIYLVDPKQSSDKRNICFQRIKASEFHLNQDVLYIKFLPDPVINKVSSIMKSGILKCKICLYNPQ